MKKLIYPDSNSSLFNSLDGVMVSVIRDTNFYTNIKKASSSAISRQLLEDCKPDKDHFLIHITAIGDDETYGFNKNADGFPKKANEKYYKTFETNANLFREHNSSSKDNRIGIIKAAAYNNDMHRIEVVAWANIKKAAAEYETALSGKPLSSSMGASVPNDRDNISGKLSKNPSEYEPWMKRFPGKFIEEWDGKPINKWAYVHNDKPTFFDLSIVANPADRIADYLEYRFNDATSHSKLASFKQEGSYKDLNIPSALLPELLGYDLTKFGSDINIFKGDTKDMIFNSDLKVKVLDKLASIEKDFLEVLSDKDSAKQKSNVKVAYIHSTKNNVFDKNYHVEESKLDELRTLRPETLFYELKKRASVLPFNVFVDLIYGNSNQKFASEEQKNNIVKYAEIEIVPTIFSTIKDLLENDEDLPCGNSIDGLFDAGDPLEVVYDINNGDTVQKIMDELGDNLSINKESKEPRIIQLTIIQADTPIEDGTESCDKFFKIKTASVNNKDANGLSGISISNADKLTAKQLAYSYAFYKIAAISDILNDFKHINIDEPAQEMLLIDTINQNFLAV